MMDQTYNTNSGSAYTHGYWSFSDHKEYFHGPKCRKCRKVEK